MDARLLALLLLPLSSGLQPPACSGISDGIFCETALWPPSLLGNGTNVSAALWLKVQLTSGPVTLSRAHVETLRELRALTILGRFLHRIPFVTGLKSIERDAFSANPNIESLHLVRHPLLTVDGLSNLPKLRFLLLRELYSLLEMPHGLLKASRGLERVQLNFVNLSSLPDDFFRGFPRLRQIGIRSLSGSFSLGRRSLAQLPLLTSLDIAASSRFYMTLKLKDMALSDLPRLREISLHKVIFIDTDQHQPCKDLGPVQLLTLRAVDPTLIDVCPQLLMCSECGREPRRFPQTLTFIGMRPSSNRSLLLPSALILPTLNVTNLFFYSVPSDNSYPFQDLSRMPLLKRFTVGHEILMLHRVSNRFRQDRLTGNPLSQLPNPNRLTRVRLSLVYCSCWVLRMASWLSDVRGQSGQLSFLQDVLQVDCLRIADFCDDNEHGPVRRHNVWVNLTALQHALGPSCTGNETKKVDSSVWSLWGQRRVYRCSCEHFPKCSASERTKDALVLLLIVIAHFRR